MQGLILAAGASRRLYPLTKNKPKCLLDIGGLPILSHQLNALKKYDINEVIIVLGYYKEMIIDYINKNHNEMKFTFIINEHYLDTNTSYSAYLRLSSKPLTSVLCPIVPLVPKYIVLTELVFFA